MCRTKVLFHDRAYNTRLDMADEVSNAPSSYELTVPLRCRDEVSKVVLSSCKVTLEKYKDFSFRDFDLLSLQQSGAINRLQPVTVPGDFETSEQNINNLLDVFDAAKDAQANSKSVNVAQANSKSVNAAQANSKSNS